jgi:hypothetical protein
MRSGPPPKLWEYAIFVVAAGVMVLMFLAVDAWEPGTHRSSSTVTTTN